MLRSKYTWGISSLFLYNKKIFPSILYIVDLHNGVKSVMDDIEEILQELINVKNLKDEINNKNLTYICHDKEDNWYLIDFSKNYFERYEVEFVETGLAGRLINVLGQIVQKLEQ